MTEGLSETVNNQPETLVSDGFCVRPQARELDVGGVLVSIERRAFDVLVYLMRNADRVVDKDELLREVWGGRPVSESTIAQAVRRIRSVLEGESQEVITTVYGVGYRFVAPVHGLVPATVPHPVPLDGSNAGLFQRQWIAVPIIVLVLVVTLVAWMRSQGPGDEALRIAVLPVQNETGDAQLDWVRLGVLPLIDSVLEDDGVRRVDTGQVLSTIRRYPEAADPVSQARVLRLNARADRVLVPRLFLADGGYRLEVSRVGGSSETPDIALQGADIPVLAVAAGQTLSESLSRWQGSKRARSGLVTDDPFINEAFVRGLDARLRGQWEEAARYFDTVLAAAPELLDAKYHLALVTRRLGDWDYTDQLHAELMDAAREGNDPGMLATVQMASGNLAWRRGNKEDAERFYQQALTHFQEQGNANYVANALGNLGILAATRAEYDVAEERMRAALEHYRAVGDRFNEATVLKNIGNLQADQGRYADAERTLLESLEIRQQLELPVQIALTMSVLGDVEMARGLWAQALAHQQRVFDTAERHDSPIMAIQALSDISAALRRLGRLEEAVARAADAYARATELGSPTNQAFALLQQGRAELDRGRSSAAIELFERSARIYGDIDQPLGATLAGIARAGALLKAGRRDEVEAWLSRIDEAASGSDIERLDAALEGLRARLAEAEGDGKSALLYFERAYRSAQDLQIPIEIVDTGGRFGLALLKFGAERERTIALAESLSDRADPSASALEFLARFHSETNPQRASALAERRRALVGEGWTAEDEAWLEALGSGSVEPGAP